MRIAEIYLRRGKVYAVGKKGSGGFLTHSGSPAVAEASVEGTREALEHALGHSIIPVEVPREPTGESPWPALAGVKTERAFYNSAKQVIVRERDDRIELLAGQRSGSGWHAKVVQQLGRDITSSELAAAVLKVFEET
jgi:hypothetical protein